MLKIAAVLLFTVVAYATAQVAPIVPEDCLGCLCQASTGCNMTMSCTGGSQYLCGPFLISWPYWADGGKFVLTDDDPQRLGAFEDCVKDPVCAGETVRGYMVKFAQDCNNDGVINCDDFARIHINGGYSCSTPIDESAFFQQYLQCRQNVALLSG